MNMQYFRRVVAASAFLAILSSCAISVPVRPGQSEAEVVARLGKPTHVYQDGANHLLEYMHGPMGQYTEIARIGPDGTLISYEQVLTVEKFATIKLGEANKETVLRTIGAASEMRFFPASGLEEWSYPFKEHGIWDSLMAVYFDQAGIVRKLQNGPDPKFDTGAFPQ